MCCSCNMQLSCSLGPLCLSLIIHLIISNMLLQCCCALEAESHTTVLCRPVECLGNQSNFTPCAILPHTQVHDDICQHACYTKCTLCTFWRQTTFSKNGQQLCMLISFITPCIPAETPLLLEGLVQVACTCCIAQSSPWVLHIICLILSSWEYTQGAGHPPLRMGHAKQVLNCPDGLH